ncbi:MAG: thermonuclease family protein [Cyclobacteriaceae bacterium]
MLQINLFIALIFTVYPQQDFVIANVSAVRDGDTIELKMPEGWIAAVRLHGIDSPDKCQKQYEQAKQYAINLLLDKKVKFVKTGIDQYNRLVGEIYIDANNTQGEYPVWFNAAIVGAGYAWHWPRYSDSQKLASMQIVAQKLKVGVWEESNPIPPWEFRKSDEYKKCNTNY